MKAAVGETFTWDDPDNYCFGCSQQNAHGLQLSFTRVARTRIRCDFRAAAHLEGAPAVVHGGIQATLLDEVLGTTAHTVFEEHIPASLVTAEFSLRYRRPVPIEAPIVVIGDLERVEGRNHIVSGRIENAVGEVLTTAEARWVRLVSVG